jgi:hypothetical protein
MVVLIPIVRLRQCHCPCRDEAPDRHCPCRDEAPDRAVFSSCADGRMVAYKMRLGREHSWQLPLTWHHKLQKGVFCERSKKFQI